MEGPCGLKIGRIRDGALSLIRERDIVWSMSYVREGRYMGESVVVVRWPRREEAKTDFALMQLSTRNRLKSSQP